MRCLFLAIVIILTVWLSPEVKGISQSDTKQSAHPQKKEQTIKVLIKKDGKLIESDTTMITKDGKEQRVMVIVNQEDADNGKVTTYTYTIGDTLQNDLERKVVRLKDDKRFIIMQNNDKAVFSHSDSSAGKGAVEIVGVHMDPYAFDPSDPDIVSYKKKDKRNGLEQITIVRKKQVR